jgi:hypothetical protein
MSNVYDVSRQEEALYPAEPIRKRKYHGPVNRAIVILNKLRRTVKGDGTQLHYQDVSHGQIALRQWAEETLGAKCMYNGQYFELMIDEECPEVHIAQEARNWLESQAIPQDLQIHLRSKRMKVSENLDGALVACFVDAIPNEEWEQTPYHAAQVAAERQSHEECLRKQREWNRMFTGGRAPLPHGHLPYDGPDADAYFIHAVSAASRAEQEEKRRYGPHP